MPVGDLVDVRLVRRFPWQPLKANSATRQKDEPSDDLNDVVQRYADSQLYGSRPRLVSLLSTSSFLKVTMANFLPSS